MTVPAVCADSQLRGRAAFGLSLALLLSPLVFAADDKTPRDLGLKESVRVGLVQLEVTVRPKEPGSDTCAGLTRDDFELHVDGEPVDIGAADLLTAEAETYVGAGGSMETWSGGMTFVLFFDLWHLGLNTSAIGCPLSKPLAFKEARRFVTEQFHKDDRLLLVTSAGWPTLHGGWIRDPDEALQALDRLEKNHQVMAPRQQHIHHEDWLAGVESLFLALGRYPGRKDVIYLGDNFRSMEIAHRTYDFAARAQANGVVVNAVDLQAFCRLTNDGSLPSQGVRCVAGDYSCFEYLNPNALAPISLDTGGLLYLNEHIAAAVSELRSLRKCRYLVSFQKPARRRRGSPNVALRLRMDRDDLSLLAPSSFQTPETEPSAREQNEALFLLPRYARGIAADVVAWPYRPDGMRHRWKALVVTRLEKTDEVPWPDELTEIRLHVIAHKDSHIYGDFITKLEGEELAAFREPGTEKIKVFPVDKVFPGDVIVSVTVTGNVEDVTANVHKSLLIPEPPGPGQAGAWFLSDRFVRSDANLLRVPSLDGVLSAGEPAAVMAFACKSKSAPPGALAGTLARQDGTATRSLPIDWLGKAPAKNEGCGWLIGEIREPLPAGLWTFSPPAGYSSTGAPPLEFTVAAADGSAAGATTTSP